MGKSIFLIILFLPLLTIGQIVNNVDHLPFFSKQFALVDTLKMNYEMNFQELLKDSMRSLGPSISKCVCFPTQLDGLNIHGKLYRSLYFSENFDVGMIKKSHLIKEYNWLPIPWILWPSRGIKYYQIKTNYPIEYKSIIYTGRKGKKQLAKELTENQDVVLLIDSLRNILQIGNAHPQDSLIDCSVQLFENKGMISLQFLISNNFSDTLKFEGLGLKIYLTDDKFCNIGILDIYDENFLKENRKDMLIAPLTTADFSISFSGYELCYKRDVSKVNLFEPYTKAQYLLFNYLKYQINGITYYWQYSDTETGRYLKIAH